MIPDDPSYRRAGHATFDPETDRSLSEAVLTAVEEHREIDLVDADFTLYDVIDPEALERLFRFNQDAATTVSFFIDETRVSLQDVGDAVEIQAAEREP